jgi:hypothetical protein
MRKSNLDTTRERMARNEWLMVHNEWFLNQSEVSAQPPENLDEVNASINRILMNPYAKLHTSNYML